MDRAEAGRLIECNDRLLEPLIRAAGGEPADREIEAILLGVAQPLTRRILGRYALSRQDAEDIQSTLGMRLIAKLRALRHAEDEAVQDLENYVAATAYNLVNDHLRRLFPERARLKSRLRYLLSHDPRFALWPSPDGTACGFASWSGRADTAADSGMPDSSDLRDPRQPARAVEALFRFCGRPLLLDTVVAFLAQTWNVVEAPHPLRVVETITAHDAASAQVEARDVLRNLWREIRELRPMQRTALLLNLRDTTSVNVTALLVVTGTASYDDLAAALGMTAEQLAALWNELPLDDLRIAGLLDVTRQQVINLRKAARSRLARRLVRNKARDSTS